MTSLFGKAETEKALPVPVMPEFAKDTTIKACAFSSSGKVEVIDAPKPLITDPKDAIIHVSLAAICGSDLHLYHNAVKGMKKGDILGHEMVGVIESVGNDVKDLKPGTRVAVSCIIADGTCWYCRNGMFSCCDLTNPSLEMEKLYGHRIAGVFGYSHLTGGYPGGQSEYVRVPYADVNCLPIPEGFPDEKAVLLSDVACTAWHACELGQVGDELHKRVCIWGCGPIGLIACAWAKNRGATRVCAIDNVSSRLALASKLGADFVINYNNENVLQRIKEIFSDEPGGPDSCLDCVGFRYSKTMKHTLEMKMMAEGDSPEVLEEAILACRKGGCISMIGDYFMKANHFPIGPMMEKALVVRGGQVFVQKYWHELLRKLQNNEIDPTPIITHRMSLMQAQEAYDMFDAKKEDVIKVVLNTQMLPTAKEV